MKLSADARRFYLDSLSYRWCWIKAYTPPPSLQAEMVQAFGKNNHTGTETTDQSDCMGDLTNAIFRLSLGVKNGTGSDDVCKALEALSVEPVRRPSRQFIIAAEEWISIEEDQDVVEAIRLDCQDEIIAEATDDGEGGGGKTSESDVSKRQDSGDTDDDLGLGDTEGPKI